MAGSDGSTSAGSVSLLVRYGVNLGINQEFNLSDQIGSGLFFNALQGGGPQELVTVNILYWREDLFQKRISVLYRQDSSQPIRQSEYVRQRRADTVPEGENVEMLHSHKMERMPAVRRWRSRQRRTFTFIRWSWTRKARSKAIWRRSGIASTWSPPRQDGSQLRQETCLCHSVQ